MIDAEYKLTNPEAVRLETCTYCQLACRDCYMRKGNYCDFQKGFLTFTNFKNFLSMNPFIKKIEISNSGEIFLNPHLEEILRYAFKKNITITASNGVNLNNLTERMAENLVIYKVQKITVSIDGASDDVYPKYRRNGNFSQVIRNIKKINKYKKMYQSEYPILQWQYIVMDVTQSVEEIKKAKLIAEELNMVMSFKKSWVEGFVPNNPEEIKSETGLVY